ncbi:MAG TPA: hypothetical protein VHE83_03375, partial [Mycobacteriales bacterium]|nr:hypothetical protein [Mycobacteriales bacterium]
PRASGPTPAPVPLLPELPAAPLPNPEALTWTDKPRPDPAARQRRAAEPVALEAARAERRTSLMPLILIVLLVLVALAAAGGLFYVQHHKAKPAAASVGALPTTAAPTEVPTTAFDEPTTPAPSAEPTASAAASAAPAADLGGTWTVTSTVTDVHGSIQGSDGKPLAKGDELTRTYALTQRCSAPGTCTLTALIRETGAFLSLTGDGTTYHGSVTADVPCSGAQKQPVTATLTVTVGDSADGKATRFTGTTTQTYTAAGSCPAASATTSLQGTRA